MKKTGIFLLFLLLFALAISLAGCTLTDTPSDDGQDPTPGEQTEPPETFTVEVVCSEGVRVTGENPLTVAKGETAVFPLAFDRDYVFDSATAGVFDGSCLKIGSVAASLRVELTAVLSNDIYFTFQGRAQDSASVDKNVRIPAGQEIVLTAADRDMIFLGWSLGGYIADGFEILSADRVCSFVASYDLAANNALVAFANYREAEGYVYEPNGGRVNASSRNMSAATDYTASLREDGSVLIAYAGFSAAYRERLNCLCCFWDDGTFVRDGYILKEYNTAPDGSGEGYSPGSKFYSGPVNDKEPTLYCIWEPVCEEDFTVADCYMPRPSSISAANAPDWQENGVIVTGWSGEGETLAIPETIGGKPVIAVAAGAFRDLAVKTVVFPRFLQEVKDGAFSGCSSLETLYLNDSIWQIGNAAFDEATYSGFTRLVVNATKAPRFANTGEGAFSMKLVKILRTAGEERVIMIAGSSAYQGFATDYLEALLGDRTVINFGTTRTTHGTIYLEAMSRLATENDIILYAPENSIYMLGEPRLYWKTLRDLESINNFYRYIDISNYTNVFGAFTEFNQEYAYKRAPRAYEDVVRVGNVTVDGDYFHPNRSDLGSDNDLFGRYINSYFITMNERVKSKDEGSWNDVANQTAHKNYADPADPTWVSFTDEPYASLVNHAFACAVSSGASAYFSFCPVDASALVEGADTRAWLAAYDELLRNTYTEATGVLGASADYVFDHEYFYDCAFHPNDYGRVWRTYQVYLDLCDLLGRNKLAPDDRGTDFDGCIFEKDCLFGPKYPFEPKD